MSFSKNTNARGIMERLIFILTSDTKISHFVASSNTANAEFYKSHLLLENEHEINMKIWLRYERYIKHVCIQNTLQN